MPKPLPHPSSPALSRRDLLRYGGGAFLGMRLGAGLGVPLPSRLDGKGFGRAKSVILVFLQGGPSHLDLWDPKQDVPADVRSAFQTIPSVVPGMEVTELLPRLAQVTDRVTFIRSMSYSPNGLFNHTAAHYQMLTGYTADKVSPSGQLEPPSPKDYPTLGSHIARLKPAAVPMLPFVMLPRPLQESNVVGKAGGAGFLGRAFDPFTLYPGGDDLDETKLDKVRVDDLALRPQLSADRIARRAELRELLDAGDAALERAVERFQLDRYTEQAIDLIRSGRARKAMQLDEEPAALRDRYGRTTFGQSCLLARRLVEAGSRCVQINWPKVANSDRHSWDCHKDLEKRMQQDAAPRFDPGFATLIEDLDQRGLLAETLVVCVGEFGRSPKKGLSTSGNDNDSGGRDHWPYCFTAVVAGAGVRRGHVHGESDATGSAPLRDAVHPCDLLATIYHGMGIAPETMVNNHLDQPRELVQGRPVLELFA